MAGFDVYGGAGNPFGGSTTSWATRLGNYNPYAQYATWQARHDAPGGQLREEEEGRGALGAYAGQAGLTQPFVDWITNPTTHRQLWDEYLGEASKHPGDYWFQDYLAENDPRLRWMNQSPDRRGETPPWALALGSRLNVKQ